MTEDTDVSITSGHWERTDEPFTSLRFLRRSALVIAVILAGAGVGLMVAGALRGGHPPLWNSGLTIVGLAGMVALGAMCSYIGQVVLLQLRIVGETLDNIEERLGEIEERLDSRQRVELAAAQAAATQLADRRNGRVN